MAKNKKIKKNEQTAVHRISQLLQSILLKIQNTSIAIKGWLFAISGWIRSRPQAIREWHKADKKKKKYRSFRLQKRIKPEFRFIPTATQLMKESLQLLWRHKKVFGFIILIYSVIYFLFVRSPITTDIDSIQEIIEIVLGSGSAQDWSGAFATLGVVLSSSGGSGNLTVPTIGIFVLSLAIVWATRQIYNNQTFKARDAYYQGMTSVFPIFIVLFIISLQLIPFAIASFLYATARTTEIFVSGAEDLAFFAVASFIGLLSLYWITSSVIALYIVSLPGMYPLQALRAAKKLVSYQRLRVFRRIIALPIMIGVVYITILLLVIRFFPQWAFITVEIAPLFVVPLANIYLYKLYRALI